MVATSIESHERFGSGPHLFMESAPVRFRTAVPPEGGPLVRRLVIAAGTATIVYVVTQLLIGAAS